MIPARQRQQLPAIVRSRVELPGGVEIVTEMRLLWFRTIAVPIYRVTARSMAWTLRADLDPSSAVIFEAEAIDVFRRIVGRIRSVASMLGLEIDVVAADLEHLARSGVDPDDGLDRLVLEATR